MTGVADAFKDGAEVAGVGGSEVADGLDVGDEGEAGDDEDVGLGEGVGGQSGGALGGEDQAEAVVAAFARPAFDGGGGEGGGAGEIVGFVEDEDEWANADRSGRGEWRAKGGVLRRCPIFRWEDVGVVC